MCIFSVKGSSIFGFSKLKIYLNFKIIFQIDMNDFRKLFFIEQIKKERVSSKKGAKDDLSKLKNTNDNINKLSLTLITQCKYAYFF